ncbi:Mediator of RNA polymerase II transcription subunit 9, partial [Dissostichus eleginoides]
AGCVALVMLYRGILSLEKDSFIAEIKLSRDLTSTFRNAFILHLQKLSDSPSLRTETMLSAFLPPALARCLTSFIPDPWGGVKAATSPWEPGQHPPPHTHTAPNDSDQYQYFFSGLPERLGDITTGVLAASQQRQEKESKDCSLLPLVHDIIKCADIRHNTSQLSTTPATGLTPVTDSSTEITHGQEHTGSHGVCIGLQLKGVSVFGKVQKAWIVSQPAAPDSRRMLEVQSPPFSGICYFLRLTSSPTITFTLLSSVLMDLLSEDIHQ